MNRHTDKIAEELRVILSARRRGTFLVFVIGVLALLSVITVSYVAVGTSDRATVTTLRERQDFDRVASETLDYLLSVPVDDLFLPNQDPIAAATGKYGTLVPQFYRRELSDYPSTSELVTSPGTGLGREMYVTYLFNPAGADNTDPWLASPEPTWLASEFPDRATNLPAYGVAGREIRKNDWAHISNFAPDGRFVNLSVLRQIRGGTRGYDAPSLALTFDLLDPTVRVVREAPLLTLTYDLESSDNEIFVKQDFPISVFNPPGNLTTGGAPFVPIRGVAGAPASDAVISPEKPVTWTRWQVGAARPYIAGPWDDGASVQYQWADADGDGIADSRWFELVEPVNEYEQDGTGWVARSFGYSPLISDPGRYRWFAAVRCIDLSGRIDVNVASDFRRLTGGTNVLPVGLTPAEIDLNRILTMQDLIKGASQRGYGDGNVPFSYNLLRDDPLITEEADQFSAFDLPTDWAGTGLLAIDNIRERLSPDYNISDPFFQEDRLFMGLITAPASVRLDPQFLPDPFGLTSLKELLTYNGVNDPANLSPLEAAASRISGAPVAGGDVLRSGRSLEAELARTPVDETQTPTAIFDDLEYDVLARSTDIRQLLTTVSGHRPIRPRTFLLDQPGVLSGEVTESLFGIRHAVNSAPLTEADLRIDAVGALEELDKADPNGTIRAVADDPTHRLFYGYAEALAPYSWLNDSWRAIRTGNVNPVALQLATLFYGYAGPELALLTAAHMTANMIDMYDDDPGANEDPAYFTLLMTDAAVPERDPASQPVGERWYCGDRELDLSTFADEFEDPDGLRGPGDPRTGRLAPDLNRTVSPAVNIYGVEAQPVIARAGVFQIYTDAPDGVSGFTPSPENFDWDGPDGIAGNGDDGYDNGGVTIDLSKTRDNADFLVEVFAVQLHNPFDHDIDLYGAVQSGGASTDAPLFYIEFGGSFYAVNQQRYLSGDVDPWNWQNTGSPQRDPVVSAGTDAYQLKAGESRVFLGFGGDPKDFQDKFRAIYNVMQGSGTAAESDPDDATRYAGLLADDLLDDWLVSQFTVTDGSDTNGPAVMPQYDPSTHLQLQTPISDSIGARTYSVLARDDDLNKQVLLWRRRVATNTTESLTANFLENDQLVDRFRLPSTDTFKDTALTGQITTASDDVAPTPGDNGYNPPSGVDETDNINRGVTFMSWVVGNRPNDVADPQFPTDPLNASKPLRWLAQPFMIESKPQGVTNTSINVRRINQQPADPGTGPDPDDFYESLWHFLDATVDTIGTGYVAAPSGVDVKEDMLDVDFDDPIFDTSNRADIVPAPNPGDANKTFWNLNQPWKRATDEIALPRDSADNSYFTEQIDVDGDGTNELVSTMRLTDLLLPIGIGPRMDPYAIDPGSTNLRAFFGMDPVVLNESIWVDRLEDLDRAWLTLPEALALAMGYYDDPHGRANPPLGGTFFDPSFQLGRENPGGSAPSNHTKGVTANMRRNPLTSSPRLLPAALDRLHLRLDTFVPFVDVVTAVGSLGIDGNFDRIIPADTLLPGGAPPHDLLANEGVPLASGVLDQFTTYGLFVGNPAGGGAVERRSFGEIDERIAGRINANTAALDTLRAVPMLSPIENGFDQNGTAGRWWWGSDPSKDRLDERNDIAATVAAYRDKRVHFSRPGGGAADGLALDFRDFIEQGTETRNPGDLLERAELVPNGGTAPGDPTGRAPDGREITNFIPGMREQPGFASLGELLAARYSLTNTAGIHGIDVLGNGSTDLTIDEPGVDVRYDDGNQDDGIINDYDEQLAVAAAAMNSLSVSSDVFAVWFVLHGYAESDVLGLAPEDPMLPSVARRYLCVFDRSNVTKPSDKPRILLFQEVPIANVRVRPEGDAPDWDWDAY